MVITPAVTPCAAVVHVVDAEALHLPPDTVMRCCRAEHGPYGHVGHLPYALPGEHVRLHTKTWHTLSAP